MKKQRFFKVLLLICILSISAICFIACKPSEPNKLPEPTSFTVESGVLKWGLVMGAKDYELVVNEKAFNEYKSTSINFYDETLIKRPITGIFNVRVKAVTGKDNVVDSDWSEFTYKAECLTLSVPSDIAFSENILTWQNQKWAFGYEVYINDSKNVVTANKMIIPSSLGLNFVDIKIIAKGDGGIYSSDSASCSYTLDVVNNNIMLNSPKNLSLKDGVLSWSSVYDVYEYKIVDYLDNITYIKNNNIDLTHFNRIKTVQAISGNSSILNSIESTQIAYLRGKGTSIDPYIITNEFDFSSVNYYETISQTRNYYKLQNDIALSPILDSTIGKNFYNVQAFYGEFDGNNKTISGVTVHNYQHFYAPFDYVYKNAVVKNVKFSNMNLQGHTLAGTDGKPTITASMMGGVCYKNSGIIQNITIENSVIESTSIVAGIAIYNYGEVKNCNLINTKVRFKADTVAANQPFNEAGGISVLNDGVINNCKVDSKSSIKGYRTVGGIAAVSSEGSTIEFCENRAKIEGYDEIGGISGYFAGRINNCINGGEIEGHAKVGGITGVNGGSVYNSINLGNIIGKDHTPENPNEDPFFLGGIVGENKKDIYYCANKGALNGYYSYGGIVGYTHDNTNIYGCYNTGNIINSIGKSEVGGIIGEVAQGATNAKMNYCYNYSSTINNGNALVGTANDLIAATCFYNNLVLSAGVVGTNITPMNANDMLKDQFVNALNTGIKKPTGISNVFVLNASKSPKFWYEEG